MQFTRENAEKVMAKAKTQTRRVVKEGEFASGCKGAGILAVWNDYHHFGLGGDTQQFGYTRAAHKTLSGLYRLKWQVGKTYAVCPGRGKPSIGRIRLLSIRPAELQSISEADCAVELGCSAKWSGPGPEPYRRNLRQAFADLWDSINPKGKRWADNPDVWVLTFEVVQ